MQVWLHRLHRVEDALLIALLAAMIALAGTQILLRNLFDAGFIRIDLFNKVFARNTHRAIQALVGQVSAWTCLLIAWYGFGWIRFDYEDEIEAFAGIPAWMLEIVIPLSFGLIGLRYFVMSLVWAHIFVRRFNRPHESDS